MDIPIGKSKIVGPFLEVVRVCSLGWGNLVCATDFGGWNDCISSFWDLMSIFLGVSSFLMDLVIFALFQGSLVDKLDVLWGIAKLVPFLEWQHTT